MPGWASSHVLDGRGVAVGQEIDDVARLEVDDDGAVALPLAPGPVVDADESRGCRGSSPRLLDATQQGIGAGRHGGLLRQPRPGFTTQGRADGEVGPGESRGRASMPGREAVERLDEDAARASRAGTEESADGHPETDSMPEDRFLGEVASVAAMDPPGLVAAGGTGCVGVRRRDAESQGVAIEVGTDQATADGGAQKLGQKQEVPPKEMGTVNRTREGITYLRSWIIKSAGEPISALISTGCHGPSTGRSSRTTPDRWRRTSRPPSPRTPARCSTRSSASDSWTGGSRRWRRPSGTTTATTGGRVPRSSCTTGRMTTSSRSSLTRWPTRRCGWGGRVTLYPYLGKDHYQPANRYVTTTLADFARLR